MKRSQEKPLILNKIELEGELKANHAYNPNGIYPGAIVDVCIGEIYTATVESIKLDSKNKKIYAHLVDCGSNVPITVDVADCRITTASTR